MKLIVGLGNPGKEYHGTRHNVGFDTIDVLAQRHHIHVKSSRSRALIGEGMIAGEKVALVKPLTFMNLSGQAVSGLVRYYRLSPSDVIVIGDDANLPLGRLRIRASGSAGGQKGLDSVIHNLSTEEIPRVRVGIGSPRGDMVNHVLSRFSRAEQKTAQEAICAAADAVDVIVAEGIDHAMNRFNSLVIE